MHRISLIGILFLMVACEASVNSRNNASSDTADTGDTVVAGTDSHIVFADTETDTCANLDLSLERQPVTIMLLIDHSASMDLQMGDNDTRWSVLVQALMGTSVDPESGLVWRLEDQVSFGMMLFTAVRNEPETCPLLTSVPPAVSNGDQIAEIFRADDETYKGASPVPEGIRAATDILAGLSETGRRVLLLATDGMPQTCDTLAVEDDPEGRTETIRAVQAAYESGISTFVVGVGDEVTDAHLQQVANAGAGLDPQSDDPAVYYRGATENSLVDAIAEVITLESRSCVYELQGKGVAPGEELSGQVLFDDEELEYNNDANGWRLKSPGEIELIGEVCEAIQTGSHHLEAVFPCTSIIIIE